MRTRGDTEANVKTAVLAGIIAAAFALSATASAQDRPAEPEGYRTDNYRSPVPATLAGARVLSTGQAENIWRSKSGIFIDVLPRPPKPANLPAGTVWRDRPRLNIPGSIWLPDTGYGTLAPSTEDYLRDGLLRASGGDPTKPLVIYCQADCWMSWNAAKRAQSYGYSNVAWYPEGTDGWQNADLPLVVSEPEPRSGEEGPSTR
jgi:PQQ-dependent catabolism-associated CXXCW motif protein